MGSCGKWILANTAQRSMRAHTLLDVQGRRCIRAIVQLQLPQLPTNMSGKKHEAVCVQAVKAKKTHNDATLNLHTCWRLGQQRLRS
jgi:hypothetical protein